MTRVLRFPEEACGQVYVMAEGAQPSQQPAQGPVEIPSGSKAFVLLDESADPALPFLQDVDEDVIAGVQAKALDADGVARLGRQTQVQQAAVGEVTDAALAALCRGSLQMLEATLVGPAGAGIAALAGLTGLHLHGDPGEALAELARSATLTRLHFHADGLGLAQLRALATSTHLEDLDVEVGAVLDDADQDVLDALVAVASGLKSLGITTANGESGLTQPVQLAILRSCPELSLNGATYTSAAVARLARKAAVA